MTSSYENIYCYVDETGQDTKGRLFIVPVVGTGREQETLRNALDRIERESTRNG